MFSRSPHRARLVTACSQLLALGVVVAALAPSTGIVSLEVVGPDPAAPVPARASAFPAYDAKAQQASLVSAEPADAEVTEVPLTAPPNARVAPGRLEARERVEPKTGETTLTSTPQPVTGYGTVGVTWEHGDDRPEDGIAVQARTRTDGSWSDWTDLDYEAAHGPDPGSAEATRERPGTDPLLVGEVDEVQVQVVTEDASPSDLELAVIEPGAQPRSEVEGPAIDTGDEAAADPTSGTAEGETADADAMELSSAAAAPARPKIYSRKQWGANESWRDKGSLHYGTIKAGFVHHTVNANDYSAAQVPALLRSIYAYHTKSRGWSDVGYNFLVDRFGRIWEGRAGGVSKPVVGAHTLGYNEYSFAMSAIGNFETAKPTRAMVQAYGALFAWKLRLSGVNPASTRQRVGRSYFQAINGHRDAGSTACPGRYLYAKLGRIRKLAASAGASTPPPPKPPATPTPPAPPSVKKWVGRSLPSSLGANPHPDLVVRRASNNRGFIIPTGGLTKFDSERQVPTRWGNAREVVATPDVTGDKRADVLVVRKSGKAMIRPGNGAGRFVKARKKMGVFRGRDQIVAVGDLNRDGKNDFVGRDRQTGRLNAFLGGGKGGFARRPLADGWDAYNKIVATGDVNGDGLVDVMGRDRAGRLWLHPGTGALRLGARVQVPGSFGDFDTIEGFGDFTRDGRADLFLRRKDNRLAYVITGRGDGTFNPATGPYRQFRHVRKLTGGGSVLGGGLPDLIGRKRDRLKAFASAGTYNLGAPIRTSMYLGNVDAILNAGDFDRDGHGDVITRGKNTGRLLLRRGDGRGNFASAIRLGDGFEDATELSVIGDLTGDGDPDLVVERPGGKVSVYPGDRAKPLGEPIETSARGTVATAWFKGLDLRPYDWVVEVSDLDGDRTPDLLVRAKGSGALYAIRRSGGGYERPSFLADRLEGYDLAG